MLLGWGVSDPSVAELPVMFTRYLSVSDGRIFASALLGLIGIPVECLCWFAIYRMIKPYSEKGAHAYRAGIIGNLLAIRPWPVNQLDHGTESFGHALVLILGLILLREMEKVGELENAEALA